VFLVDEALIHLLRDLPHSRWCRYEKIDERKGDIVTHYQGTPTPHEPAKQQLAEVDSYSILEEFEQLLPIRRRILVIGVILFLSRVAAIRDRS